ncbi:hypothetical protein [Clostridium oryzae]|uniref:Fibronectin type III domain protein n=1 Tax=Clostridium oryzae TaxID=1450648 RepID=A0A1V4ILT2_9CLOT|nr:hypothetical protein [Clostridium oryzae]OPJ60991.1 fibronectin type III domain protein [Clostridium oryzae]
MKLKKSISLALCLFFLCLFNVDTFAKTKLAKPTGVIVTADSEKIVTVHWKKVSSASYYYVYYSTSYNGKYVKSVKISTTAAKSFLPFTKGQTYYFKVKAVKGKVTSPYSKIAKIKITSSPSTPKNVKVTYNSKNGKIKLTWNKVRGVKGYYVYCSNDKTYGYQIICDAKMYPIMYKKTSASFSAAGYGFKVGQKIYFKISAVRSEMESKQSSSKAVTIKANKVKCFPKLTDVPVIPDQDYTLKTSSDGTIAYCYALSDFNTNTESNYHTLLANNGWEYEGKADKDGYKIFGYTKAGKEIRIYKTDTQFIITGYYTN